MKLIRTAHDRSSLRHGLVAGSGIQANQSTLRSSMAIATCGDVQCNSSTIRANVVTSGTVSRRRITGNATNARPCPRTARSSACDGLLLGHGTAISLAACRAGSRLSFFAMHPLNRTRAGGMRSPTANLSRSSSRALSGAWSLRVSSRSSRDDSSAQDINVSPLQNGNLFHLASRFILPPTVRLRAVDIAINGRWHAGLQATRLRLC